MDWVTYEKSDIKCLKNNNWISLPILDFLAENAAINWIEITLLYIAMQQLFWKKMKKEIRADKKKYVNFVTN